MNVNTSYVSVLDRVLDDLWAKCIAEIPYETLYRLYGNADRIGRAMRRDLAERIAEKIDDKSARVRIHKDDYYKRLLICVDSDVPESDWNVWIALNEYVAEPEDAEPKQAKTKMVRVRGSDD